MSARLSPILALLALAACDDKGEPADPGALVDNDSDGYSSAVDCDDAHATVHPDADELCDGKDNDCDGEIDEDPVDQATFYADSDGDGYGDPALSQTGCEADPGYTDDNTDCDDSDGAIHPGASEPDCTDPVDYNCDGSAGGTDADGDGSPSCEDCDDADPARSPLLSEICDEADVDEDCSGAADDADPATDPASMTTWYRDADSDGYSAGTGTPLVQCEEPTGYTSVTGDCDDYDTARNPGATEICDKADTDEDCDLLIDDEDPSVDPSTWLTFYKDGDGDGYGDAARTVTQCDAVSGYVEDDTDCDDADAAVNPGGTEVCDASDTDEDCDGLADDADPSASGASTWYTDGDGDGYGDTTSATFACEQPAGTVSTSGDCDDGDAAISPVATEICDAADTDEDCDGLADDADSAASGKSTWYLDADSDGYGLASSSTSACDQPSGYAATSGDCDDGSGVINPAATEICDASNTDEDCDGVADDADSSASGKSTWYRDADSDGYGSSATTSSACDQPSGYVSTATDCDDTDGTISPAGAEICDSANEDEDCDGLADDADSSATGKSTFYYDGDGDGFGTSGTTSSRCDASSTYVTTSTDCDDGDGSANPDATEICGNGTDEDCDGTDPSCDTGAAPSGTYSLDAITTRVEGEASSTYAGGRSSIVGDFNNDGYDDLLIPATGNSYGEGFLFNGPLEGAYTTNSTDADASYTGYASGDYAYSLANIGDQNADGYQDFAVGAYASDIGASNAGAVYIVNGPLTGALSLSSSLPVFYGSSASDTLGYSVSGAGDTNDDGYADLLVGAYGVSSSYGAVYLIEGDFAAGARSAATYAATTWVGEATSYAGRAVLGNVDLNGDGEEDVVIGAYGYNSAQGRVYVYYGPLPTGTVTLGTSTADAVLTGTATNDDFGITLAVVPDMDGDGIDELAVGAYGNDDAASNAGKVYVFYGPLTGSISTSAADITVSGLNASDYAGYSIAGIEDIDGDGGGELLVGAYAYDPGSTTNGGGAFLFYSGATGDLDFLDADASFEGSSDADYAGYTVGAAGDFDADGTPDLYVAAYCDEYESSSYTQTGLVYLVPGDLDNELVNAADTTVSGVSYEGYRVASAGDFNHDGYADVVTSSQYSYGYVMLHLGPLTTSATTYDAVITGDGSSDYLGMGLDGGGRVNTDTYDDVLVGAPYADSGASNAGEVYLIAGRSTPISYTAGTSAYANYYGATASDYLGWSVSLVEDWDGDGYDDMLIGAPGWDSPASNAGAAFLFYGGTNGTFASSSADATLTGESTGDAAGTAVAIVGDIDGDGYDDVAVGAPTADPHGTSSGTAYLLLGPLSGSASLSTADAQLDGVETGEQVGETLDGAGDVDGDGYEDWLAGSNNSDRGYSNGGEVYLIHGPESGVDAPFLYLGPYDSSYAGQGGGAGDLDADGYDDFLIGGYGKSKAWVFFGG